MRRKSRLQLNNLIYAALVLLVASLLTVFGCNSKEQGVATQKSPAPVQKAIQKPVSSASTVEAVPTSQFDFNNKKDPFKPFITLKQGGNEATKKVAGETLPAHSFDIRQFKVVGIISGDGKYSAMLVDPDGKAYVVKVGTYIGKKDGVVTAINGNSVTVQLRSGGDQKNLRKELVKLTLAKKQV